MGSHSIAAARAYLKTAITVPDRIEYIIRISFIDIANLFKNIPNSVRVTE